MLHAHAHIKIHMSSLQSVKQSFARSIVIQNMAPSAQPPTEEAICLMVLYFRELCACSPPPIPRSHDTRAIVDHVTKISLKISQSVTKCAQANSHIKVSAETVPSTMLRDTFPYLAAMVTGARINESAPVYVAQSNVAGLGVFASRDIKINEFVTVYPVDAIRLMLDKVPKDNDRHAYTYLYLDSRRSRDHAEQHWIDYKMHCLVHCTTSNLRTDALCFYGDPSVHPPNACGHMINDPRDTCFEANCIECVLCGGIVTAILSTANIAKGSELLMEYGDDYWRSRLETQM